MHVVARLQRHDDFFQRGVAGALADAVDRAFDLPRAVLTAASELATAKPRSSWQCDEKTTPAGIGIQLARDVGEDFAVAFGVA